MSELLAEVLAAHGGGARWEQATSITARGRFGGLLARRFPGTMLADLDTRVHCADQHAVLFDFPTAGQRAVFDRGEVWIESSGGARVAQRRDPRRHFSGRRGLRRHLHWDALDAAYFAGYALWNYLTTPWLLARADVAVAELEPLASHGCRRLQVRFPEHLHTHCERQTFHVGNDGLIHRHDYVAEPVGRWAFAAHRCDQHRTFDGLVFPTRRRVSPRGPGNRPLGKPILVALDIDRLEISS